VASEGAMRGRMYLPLPYYPGRMYLSSPVSLIKILSSLWPGRAKRGLDLCSHTSVSYFSRVRYESRDNYISGTSTFGHAAASAASLATDFPSAAA
jgi:hypothetical protein